MTFDVTSSNRPPHESRSQPRLDREELLRIANAILDRGGNYRSQGYVLELVRRYEHQVDPNGWAFFAYFTNALLMSEPATHPAGSDPEVQRPL